MSSGAVAESSRARTWRRRSTVCFRPMKSSPSLAAAAPLDLPQRDRWNVGWAESVELVVGIHLQLEVGKPLVVP